MELKGYKLIEELFVDSSGFGSPDELALTREQFEKKLLELLDQHGQLNATITGVGQFQVYVGLFKKEGVKKSKIVAPNTLEIIDGDKKIIRLYDTNIITFLKDGKIILNTGGFNTRTTSARMNEFLNKGFVYRKNWEMVYSNGGKNYKFENDILTI
jgi:hypothetical protein